MPTVPHDAPIVPSSSHQTPFTMQGGILSLVDSHARTSPAAVAVSAPDAHISYGQLATYSDELASRLRGLKSAAGSRVAVCLPRSAAMIISELAVLKAGCAYVSLDPAHPDERLSFALKDSGTTLLITDIANVTRLANAPCQILTVSASDFADASDVSFSAGTTPDSAAYIIYTSGSTGQQRGVEITHANLLNLVHWHIRQFSVTSEDRATQIASPAFDAAVWEIWPYLAAGAGLHIPPEETRSSPEAFRDFLVNERITITFVPTVLAERMMTLSWPADSSLRTMLTGGDTLHHYPSSKLPFALINNYGPTEATVVTTSGKVQPSSDCAHLPSIGAPIDSCQVHILGEQLRPVPTGEVGEICIGGAGVARGYVNRPELTAQKFIPDPFSPDPAARLYRSGDLAKVLPNGELLFLGRMDDQIKIRGYRIEPQEIISAVNSFSTIQDSFVTVGTDKSGERCIVSYVVSTDPELRRSELVEFLSKKLPPYMIPAVFVRMESLPATHNGKIDRAALPAPNPENTLAERAQSQLVNQTEETVLKILQGFLCLQEIGKDENFFLLGGHSLLGTQVIIKVREVFGVELHLREIFQHPTAAELSSRIDKLLGAKNANNQAVGEASAA